MPKDCIFILVKILAQFHYGFWHMEILRRGNRAVYFSCVASAAHFLFWGEIYV